MATPGTKTFSDHRLFQAKIVPDLRLFQSQGVSKEWGRKVMAKLVERGEISPLKTPTGRSLLSFEDAERLTHEF